MAYKFKEMDPQQARKAPTVPTVVLKIISDPDGTIRIAELVRSYGNSGLMDGLPGSLGAPQTASGLTAAGRLGRQSVQVWVAALWRGQRVRSQARTGGLLR
jgi:hypothetical protein